LGKGMHGGADPVMLGYIFDPEAMPEDRYNRASDHIAGAYSILTGIAANMSIDSGSPVDIPTMLKSRGIDLGERA
jgi:hypothetical protein